MAKRSRAQMALLGLMALAFVVLLVLYLRYRTTKVERQAAGQEQRAKLTAQMLEQVRRMVDDTVRESVYEAANAVGQSGGFTAENIPAPNHNGLPVYVYLGKVANFPTDRAMARMLRFEVARRIESNLHDLVNRKEYRVSKLEIEGDHITIPEESLQVGDNFIKVTVEVPIKLTYDNVEDSVRETIEVNLPLRLFRLHKMALAFVHIYTEKDDRYTVAIPGGTSRPWYRKLEFWIDYIVGQDFRLPRPSSAEICKPFNLPDTTNTFHPGFCLPGDKDEVSIPFTSSTPEGKSVKGSFGDDVTVATTIFSSRAQTKEYQGVLLKYLADAKLVTEMDPAKEADVLEFMRGFSWGFSGLIGGSDECYPDLNLTLNGKRDNLVVTAKSQKDTGCFQSCPAGMKYKSYKANYSASFPVEVTITDLLPTGKIVGGATLLKPLQFRFVIYPYLELGDEARTDIKASTNLEEGFDLECAGQCVLALRVHGPAEGEVIVEPCKDKQARFTSPEVRLEGVPCGIRDVRVLPDKRFADRFAPLRAKIALPSTIVDVTLREYHRMEGRVVENTTVFCERDERLACLGDPDAVLLHPGVCAEGDRGRFRPLGFIGGMPPSYVTVQLVPLNASLEMLTTNTEADGRYVFEKVLPGTYLLLAHPNRDFGGNIGYKVKPYAEVLAVKRSESRDIVMTSVFSVNVTGRFVPVYRIQRC